MKFTKQANVKASLRLEGKDVHTSCNRESMRCPVENDLACDFVFTGRLSLLSEIFYESISEKRCFFVLSHSHKIVQLIGARSVSFRVHEETE